MFGPCGTRKGLVQREATMKKLMVVLFCAFLSVLSLGLCTVALERAFANSCYNSPDCPAGDIVSFPGPDNPSSANADGSGNFGATLSFQWTYYSVPHNANVVYKSTGSSNIGSVTYSPTFFDPSVIGPGQTACCAGAMDIDVSGALGNNSINGTLKTDGSCNDPSHHTTHTLTINHG